MSQDNKEIISLDLFKKNKKNKLTDKEKIVYSYHLFENKKDLEAQLILASVSQQYYMSGLYKDISRALLCYVTFKTTNELSHYKESEFYLIIYRLTKKIVKEKIVYKNSGYIAELKDTLFKDFDL